MKDTQLFPAFLYGDYIAILVSITGLFIIGLIVGWIFYRWFKVERLSISQFLLNFIIGAVPLVIMLIIIYDVSGLVSKMVSTGFFSIVAYIAAQTIVRR